MEKNGVLFAHVQEPIFSYGGRAGWRMMGCVAVFACYWTSATLLAHVPEPIDCMVEGRVERTVFSSHPCRSHLVCMVEEQGGKELFLYAHVPEQKFCIKEGRMPILL